MYQLLFQKTPDLGFMIPIRKGGHYSLVTEELLSRTDCAGIRGHLTIFLSCLWAPPSLSASESPHQPTAGSAPWAPTVLLCLMSWSRALEPLPAVPSPGIHLRRPV